MISIDTTPPKVSKGAAVTTTVSGVTTKVVISLTLDEAATLAGGTPTLSLSNGGTATYDAASSTTKVLKFLYLPSGADQTTHTLVEANTGTLAITAFHANGATLTDASQNATSVLTVPALAGVLVHTSTADTWLSKTGGDFLDDTKWSTGHAPDKTQDAALQASGTYTVTVSGTTAVASVYTAKGATLDILTGHALNAVDGTGGKDNAGTIILENHSYFTLGDVHGSFPQNIMDAFNNKGMIRLNGQSQGGDTQLEAVQSITLQGGGKITMSDATNNYIAAGGTMTNADNTISGAGQIFGDVFINGAKGTIMATGFNVLDLQVTSFTNAGKLIGQSSGGLYIESSLTNTGTITAAGNAGVVTFASYYNVTNEGTISAATAASSLYLGNMTITGGTVSSVAKSYIKLMDGGTSTITDATFANAGTLIIMTDNTLKISNTSGHGSFTNTGESLIGGTLVLGDSQNSGSYAITNKGTIKLSGDQYSSVLNLDQDVTLKGGGKMTLSDTNGNIITSTADLASVTLTNADNTISGSGQFGDTSNLHIINQAKGSIIATGTDAALTLHALSVENNGKILGQGTAGLVLSGDANTTVHNTGTIGSSGTTGNATISGLTISNSGLIGATSAGSTVTLAHGTIQGGKVSTVAKSFLTVTTGNSVITGAAFANAGTTTVTGNSQLMVTGDIKNTGTLNTIDGQLVVTGAITGGKVLVTSSAYTVGVFAVEFGASTANIVFDGNSTSVVVADVAAKFGGSITGFGGEDVLNLKDVNFAGASLGTTSTATKTLLTLNDGTHKAVITFNGDYTHDNFYAADDGNGHINITVAGVMIDNSSAAEDDAPRTFYATAGMDTFYGNNFGTDILSYAKAISGVMVDLNHPGQNGNVFSWGDLISGINNMTGSAYGDELTASANGGLIMGGGGADALYAVHDHARTIFGYTAVSDSGIAAQDTIFGFTDGQDKLQFNKTMFSKAITQVVVEADGATVHAKTVGEVWVSHNDTDGQTVLSIDINGDGKIDSHDMRIVLDGADHHLMATDFLLV